MTKPQYSHYVLWAIVSRVRQGVLREQIVGVFSSRALALQAFETVKAAGWPDDIRVRYAVHGVVVGESHWPDGFVTVES